ncbi:MAG: hypothetical protein FJW99_05610 [Actinobacteria bacterium]|nr:hypothetical protein [Actinomycetota bacterium]
MTKIVMMIASDSATRSVAWPSTRRRCALVRSAYAACASSAIPIAREANHGPGPSSPGYARPMSRTPSSVVAAAAAGAAALQAFARGVSTPGSPRYREYLIIPQVAARFGARPAAVRAVRARLAEAGFGRPRLDVTRGFLTVDVPAQRAQELQRAASDLGPLVTGVETSTRRPRPRGIANTPTPGG